MSTNDTYLNFCISVDLHFVVLCYYIVYCYCVYTCAKTCCFEILWWQTWDLQPACAFKFFSGLLHCSEIDKHGHCTVKCNLKIVCRMDFGICFEWIQWIVTLCKTAPYRNSLTYLFIVSLLLVGQRHEFSCCHFMIPWKSFLADVGTVGLICDNWENRLVKLKLLTNCYQNGDMTLLTLCNLGDMISH